MSEMTEQMQAELSDLKLELKETDDLCDQLQNREKKLMMQLHLCEEREAKLQAQLDIAVDAIKYVISDYPKSYIHDSDYERCHAALKKIEEAAK